MNLQQQTNALFDEQLHTWSLATKNFADLAVVQTRTFEFDGFAVKVQFNPARMVSSGAKVDAKTIAERPCFLCAKNRPAKQHAVDFGNYEILINPFPIFPKHFTIPRKTHEPQQIEPYFNDLLELSRELPELVVFYNGPRCGASAPDHMHFQAGTKDFLPLLRDYDALKATRTTLYDTTGSAKTYVMHDYLRTVYCIGGTRPDAIQIAFMKLYNEWIEEPLVEPMMNIVATYNDNAWRIFVIPRGAFRPWQYTAEGDKQLLVSPATVEMSGMFITPVREHFERITHDDIADILKQASK